MGSVRLGVDIGGTFTDVVLEADAGRASAKVLTTHDAPERAILEGLRIVCAEAGVDPGRIDQIIHGTTLATNALIERRGARTALITTEGFRDVVEMRTESRFEQYDLNLVLPEPLLPRRQRYTLRERVGANGEILVPLARGDVEALAGEIAAAGYESIAVGFLHSYVVGDHERLVREVLAERLPHVPVSLSCEVSPQMREYERFSTTIANAYVKPLMASYLGRLVERLRDAGARCPVFLMHSGGGIVSVDSAAEFPVRLVESGPAGGAVFAATVARAHGLDRVLSFDMGGTTAKICLIDDMAPRTARTFEVARTWRFRKGSGMPISIPVIDMVEIGAGGGSLAHVDRMRQIRVGPRSAGSEPGPACYGRGGNAPAVTDADLVLGRLDPDGFAGGTMTLDAGASDAALARDVGDLLGMDALAAAHGLSEVVDENMANAARVHAVENGRDLADYTMIAFGGAAPLHANRLCEKLGIGRCLVPPGAGVGSAIGFLRAPFSFEATRTVRVALDAFDASAVAATLDDLEREATAFVRGCAPDAPIGSEVKAWMRYTGQGWEIPVTLSPALAAAPDADAFRARFETEYAALFGRTVDGASVEITVWSVLAGTAPAAVAPVGPVDEAPAGAAAATRSLFDPAPGARVEADVFERAALAPGARVDGPAVIVEDETTIVVPSSRTATVRADGCVDCERRPGEPAAGRAAA